MRVKKILLGFMLCGCLCVFSSGVDNFMTKTTSASTTETFTSGEWQYQLDENEQAVITAYTGSETEITIDQIDGKDVVAVGAEAFKDNLTIEKIVLGETIKIIDDYAFYNCKNLVQIQIPKELEVIGDRVFCYCGFEEFVIPESVTEIGESILNFNTGLQEVTIEAKLSDLKDICNSCSNLTKVTIPDGLKILNGFWGCYDLESITIPESVETIEARAIAYTGIKSVYIPANVTEIQEGAFICNENLRNLAVAKENTNYHVQTEMLFNNNGILLTTTNRIQGEISLPENCTRIGDFVFANYENITKITIPESIKEIGEQAFVNCKNLSEINVHSDIVKIGRRAFESTAHYYEESNWERGVYYLENYALEIAEVECAYFRKGCTLICEQVCEKNTDVKKVVLPESIKYIGKKAFHSCSDLESVIGGGQIEQIGEMAFGYASNLKDIYLGGESIVLGKQAFCWCDALENVVFDAKQLICQEDCFYYSSRPQNVIVPSINIGLNLTYSTGTVTYLNVESDDLHENGEKYFEGYYTRKIFLNIPKEDFADANYSWMKNNQIYFQEDFSVCRFWVDGILLKVETIESGSGVIPPVTAEENFAFSIDSPVYCNMTWDINGDGIADSFPERINQDIEANAVYEILEETHSWAVQEGVSEGECGSGESIGYQCLICGAQKTVTGHLFSDNWTVDEAATCISAGVKSYHCLRTGCEEKISVTSIPSEGHNWDKGTVTKKAKEAIDGEIEYECEACGEIRTEVFSMKEVVSGDWKYKLNEDARLVVTGYLGSATELTVEKIDGKQVYSIGEYAFSKQSTLKKVVLAEGIQRIEDRGFTTCNSLESVILPESLSYIGTYCFEDCGSLTEMIIPEGVKEIGKYLFHFSGLKKLDIQAKLTSIEEMGCGCRRLEEVSFSEGLKELSGFWYCKNLKELEIPDSVEIIRSCTFRQSGIESLRIPAGVTNFEEGAFYALPNLTEIQVAEENEKYYVQDGMLFNTNNVLLVTTNIHTGEVEIPQGCIRIGDSAFRERVGITKVIIPDTVKEIGGWTFNKCTDLYDIHVGEQLTRIGESTFFGTAYYNDQSNWKDNILYLGNYALKCMSEETVLQINEGCTLIADNFEGGWLQNDLEILYLPDSMEYIGYHAFGGCSKLKKIIGGKKIKRIGARAFTNAESLENVYISGTNVYIEEYAFSGCSSVEFLYIDAEKVTCEENALLEVYNLHTMILPNLNRTIDELFFSTNYFQNIDLVITNMTSEEILENSNYFRYFTKNNIYINNPQEDFVDCNESWIKNNTIYYKGQYHTCTFTLDEWMMKVSVLEDGAKIIVPEMENQQYQIYTDGPIYFDIAWDYNNDKVADSLPEQLYEDMEMVALYQKEITHNWEENTILQQLTCEQDGLVEYLCSGCKAVKTETILATGHTFSTEWTEDVAATCTGTGIKSRHCTKEGCDEKTDVKLTLSTGHIWHEEEETDETETLYVCKNCGATRTEGFEIFSGDWKYYLDENDKVIITGYTGKATELTIDKIDGKDVIAIDSYAFNKNNTLKNVVLGEGIQRLEGYGFRDCDGIKSIDLPDSLQYIGDFCFQNCDGIEEITIPEGVKELGSGVLDECYGLKKLVIKANITTTKSMCWDCYALEEVYLPEGLKELSGFRSTKKLKTIEIPDSVERISYQAFEYGGLESLQIPASVTEIEETAFACSENLSEIQIAEGNENFYIQNEMLFSKEGVLLVATKEITGEVEIPSGCIRIGENAFVFRQEITKIVIPDTTKEIGSNTFGECKKLREIQVGTQLTWIGAGILAGTAYYNDEENWNEQTLYLANYAICSKNTEPVLRIREGCTLLADSFSYTELKNSLEVLYFPDSMQYIGVYAFFDCKQLKQVIGGKNITCIRDSAFYGNESLKTLYIQGEEVEIKRRAFNECYSLTNFIVDANKITMEEEAFWGTLNIQNMVLPNLSQDMRAIFGIDYYVSNKNIVITNMSMVDYTENVQPFDALRHCNLYLNHPVEDFADKSFPWMNNNRIYYKNQYHLCKFFLENCLLDMVVVEDGEELEALDIKYNSYQFYDEGPIYANITWDYNEDGIADEMPEQVKKDMELVALYKMEERHTWELKSVLQPVSCEQDGILLYVCSECLAKKEEIVTRREHSWDEGVIKKEEIVYTCRNCGMTKTEMPEFDEMTTPTPTGSSEASSSPTVTVTEKPKTTLSPSEPAKETPTVTLIPIPSVTLGVDNNHTTKPTTTKQPNGSDSHAGDNSTEEVLITLRVNKKNFVVIQWNSTDETDSYEIFRSVKKKKGYKKIKEVSGGRTKFIDKTVIAGKKYYYRVERIQAKGTSLEKRVGHATSSIRSPWLLAPKISIVKKNAGFGIKYIQVTLKKYQGNKVEIQYRKRKGEFKKLALLINDIKKMKRRFKIQYLSGGSSLYIRVRTYSVKNKKKEYSKWSKKKIRL